MRHNVIAATIVALLVVSVEARSADAPAAYQINVAHSGVVNDASLKPPFFKKWQVTLPGRVSYPLIAEGLVFVTTGDYTLGVTASVYALDQLSGQLVWTHAVPHGSTTFYPWWSAAAYDNGRIFVIDGGGVLTAFNAADGVISWSEQLPLQYSFNSPPTAMNGVVYVGGSGAAGTVYAVDELTGNVLATRGVENGDHSSPTLSDSAMFVSYVCDQAYAFTVQSLTPSWHHDGGCEGGGGQTTVYANGRLFTRDFLNGNLILDSSDGTVLGTYTASAAPAASGSTLWARTGTNLVAEDVSAPASPLTLWTFSGDGQLNSAPILISTGSGDFVIEGSASGNLYALTAAAGTPVWNTNVGTGINGSDDFDNIGQPPTGFAAGHGLLLIPAGNTLSAFTSNAASIPALSSWVLLVLALSVAVIALRSLAS